MKNRSGMSGVQVLLVALLVVGGAYLAYKYMHKQASTETPVEITKTIITLLGKPEAGKGTLSATAQKELGFVTLSTGDLVRAEIAKDSDLGKMFKAANAEGKLVADEPLFGLVKEWLVNNAATSTVVILDGFPRNATQAAMLTDFIKNELKDFKLRVIELQISDDEVIKRAANRLVCEQCRAIYSASKFEKPEEAKCEKCGGNLIKRTDDDEKIVRARLEEYNQTNKPLVEFYRSAGYTIEEIPTDRTAEDAFNDFKALLAK